MTSHSHRPRRDRDRPAAERDGLDARVASAFIRAASGARAAALEV
jgi:hypothetical protein